METQTRNNKLIARYELKNGGQVLVVETSLHGIEISAVVVVQANGLIAADGMFMSEKAAKTAVLANLANFAAGDYSVLEASKKL